MMPSLYPQPPQRRETRVSRLLVGVFFLFIALGTFARTPRTGTLAYELGRFTGALILAAPAIWLITSGLPKMIGLDAAQRRTRRRTWYGLAGAGFIIMMPVSFLLTYFGWFAAGAFVSWAYWLGWMWISWIIADKKIVERSR